MKVNALKVSVYPLMEYVKHKLGIWSKMPLSVVGRINLIKTILPKFLYVFSHSPVIIPKPIFNKLNSHFTGFIRANVRCKLKLTTLQRMKPEAGVTLPNMYLYYLAGQLKHLQRWVSQEQSKGVKGYLLKIFKVNDFLVGLEAQSLMLSKVKIPIVTLRRLV